MMELRNKIQTRIQDRIKNEEMKKRECVFEQIKLANDTWNEMKRDIISDASSRKPKNFFYYIIYFKDDLFPILPLIEKLAFHNDKVILIKKNYKWNGRSGSIKFQYKLL